MMNRAFALGHHKGLIPPLAAVFGSRLPWAHLESVLAPAFARKNRDGKRIEDSDLEIAGGGMSAAGRPRLSICLMASLLYLKHTYNLSDEDVVERWAENGAWQYFSGQTYYEAERLVGWMARLAINPMSQELSI